MFPVLASSYNYSIAVFISHTEDNFTNQLKNSYKIQRPLTSTMAIFGAKEDGFGKFAYNRINFRLKMNTNETSVPL